MRKPKPCVYVYRIGKSIPREESPSQEPIDLATLNGGHFINLVETGRIGRNVAEWNTPRTREEVLGHYAAHSAELEEGEILGVFHGELLGSSDYELLWATFNDPELFADYIGVSERGTGARKIYAVPSVDMQGLDHDHRFAKG